MSKLNRMGTQLRLTSLEPIVSAGSKVIVLGSMPGGLSLEQNEYYAHPRNRFWRVIGDTLQVEHVSYDARIHAALSEGIGLWDVLKHCVRVGSLDRRISTRSEVPNDLPRFLAEHESIETLLFNGRKAEDAFRRHVLPALPVALKSRLKWHVLPSTSPANAKIAYPKLFAAWRSPLEAAGIGG